MRLDPNAIPASGPEFLTATIPNRPSFTAQVVTIVATANAGLLNISASIAGAAGQRNFTFGALSVSGPGVVQLTPSGSSGSVIYSEINVSPPSALAYVSNQTGAGGTVTIDVFDLASNVVTGRFSYTGLQSGNNPSFPTTATITGSFRAYIQ